MKISKTVYVVFAVLTTGVVQAHEGAHLVAHAHPHLGAEHLLFGLFASALATGFAVWRRRG